MFTVDKLMPLKYMKKNNNKVHANSASAGGLICHGPSGFLLPPIVGLVTL